MKDEFEKDFRKSVREIIQKVMAKYKLTFDRQPIWQTIVEYLPAESVLSKSLRRHKAESIGNIPQGRDALDLQKILEGLLSSGGDRVKYLDSNELWESSPDLQATLQQYLVGEIIHPERVLLMTTDPLFHLLGTSAKISVDGTFRIAPSYWKQVFILQVCEKKFGCLQFFSTMKSQMSSQIDAKANTV